MIRKFRREDGPEQPSVLRYLENRAGKCFTVVQCETAENRGSTNACRQPVLIGGGFSRPATKDGADNDYWDHVDWVVNQAVAQGLYLAVLPTWEASRAPEHAMDRDRRIAYGCSRFLGQRYGCRSHLVWMLGGDAWQRGADMDTPALLTMIRAMTQGIADGATAISAAVENVHIKNVTCSNGTIDYFKWDPDGEQALQNPTLNFTIADADPHQYEWIIYFRKTSGSDTWTGEYWAASGEVSALWPNQDAGTSEETVSVNLADPEVSGHLAAGVHPWCTYTYDIVVRELAGEAQLDRYGLKEPYCMWIPAHPPGQTEGEGHSVWVHVPEAENAPAELRVKYAINDQCLTPNAQDFNLIVVDPLLQEHTAVGKPWPDTTGVMQGVEDADEDGKPDGIKVYEFTDDDPGGTWRVLWTAAAPCGTKTRYRRTHDAQRMLVANYQGLSVYAVFADDVETFPAMASKARTVLNGLAAAGQLRDVTPSASVPPEEAVSVRDRMYRGGWVFLAGHGIDYMSQGGTRYNGVAVETQHRSVAYSDALTSMTWVAEKLAGLPYPATMDTYALVSDGRDEWSHDTDPAVANRHKGLPPGSYRNCGFLFICACNSAKSNYSVVQVAVINGGVRSGLGFTRVMHPALASSFNNCFWDAVGARKDWDRGQWAPKLDNCFSLATQEFWKGEWDETPTGAALLFASDDLNADGEFAKMLHSR